MTLFTNDGERSLGTHVATPDTGANATVIGRQQFLALGLSLADLQPPLHDEVAVANGENFAMPGHVSAADTIGSAQHRRPRCRLRLRRWHPPRLVRGPRLGTYP